jgi:hypothetical protein
MLLRDALPRFYAEATAAIAAKPDDEMPAGVSRGALIAQFDTLVLISPYGSEFRCGSFRVTAPGRRDQEYVFSFPFDIPSGNVVADLDRSFQITSFEPISERAIDDLQAQLDAISPVKNGEEALPVAVAWRPTLCAIVRALAKGDYELTEDIPSVELLPGKTATQIRKYVASYGATLIELPDETWETSCAQWSGSHWDVFVDLWTQEEGRSDMLLQLAVAESDDGYRFKVHLVYVP